MTPTPIEHEQAISTQAAERYVLGQMDPLERDAYELHYFECPACRADVENATWFMENGQAVAQERRAPKKSGLPWWYAAVAALLVLGAITSYLAAVRLPSLERQLAQAIQPQAVVAFAVKAATRGEENPLVVDSRATAFALQFDLPEVAYPQYRCVITPAAGGATLSIPSAPPSAGSPLTLLIPSRLLSPGSHTVQVLGDNGEGKTTPVAQFVFLLQKGNTAP